MKIAPLEIVTPRVRLRQFRDEDLDPFAAMNSDPQVMEFFPRLWSREESQATLIRIREGFQNRGFGVYAAEVNGAFAGIAGLGVAEFQARFTPCVEILWRLAHPFWRRGYASEAARAVLAMAFQNLAFPEILAFTASGNARSIRVMEQIGMQRDLEGDFDHPAVGEQALKRHVLYRPSSQV